MIQLVSTVILARILKPEDFGTFGMVTAITTFANLFRDAGLSTAAIQREDLTGKQQSNLFWLNIGVGTILAFLIAASAPLISSFYHRPTLVPVILAMSISPLIGALGAQHSAKLSRELRFGKRSIAVVSGALVTLIVSITVARQNSTYWALVYGNLSGLLTTTILLIALSGFVPTLPSRGSGLRPLLAFGSHVSGFNLINYFHRNTDSLLLGRYWGAESLGYYNRAYSLLTLPINSIVGPINSVAFPALSRLQNDEERFRRYFLEVLSIIALLSMPLASFLLVAAEPIILLILGQDWEPVTPVFQALSIAALVQPTASFSGSLLLSLGRSRRYLNCVIFNTSVIIAGFLIGVQWGPIGVATSYAITNIIVLYPWLSWALKDSPVSLTMCLKVCAFPFVVSSLGVIGAYFCTSFLDDRPPLITAIAQAIFFAMASSTSLLTKSGRTQFYRYLSHFKHLRKQT